MNAPENPPLARSERPTAGARTEAPLASDAARQSFSFEQCARLSLILAERAQAKAKRQKAPGSSDALVCDLCRQSVYWSLRALNLLGAPREASGSSGVGAEISARRDPDLLLGGADPELLARVAGSPEAAQALVQEISGRHFVAFAELEAEHSARLARELLPFTRKLLRVVDLRQWELDRPWFRRMLWALLGLMLLGVSAFALIVGREVLEERRDIAKGKPWSASTLYTESGGCDSPLQDCPSKEGFLFHTEEENRPWFKIDLGSVQSVSGARIENRQDCCKERAVPLIIEVSTDQKRWKEVARQEQVFDSWKVGFSVERARYVRVSTHGFKILHLNRVRIFP